MALRLLVADDNEDLILTLSERLQWMGHEVVSARDGQAALTALETNRIDLVMLDVEMPRLSGSEALRRIKQRWPDLPVIMLTGHGSIRLAVEAMKDGAMDFITKPLEFSQLESVISKAMERNELKGEITRLLGEISHDVKNLLMPLVTGTDLLADEIEDLFNKLPEMEAVRSRESHKLCDEVIEMLQGTSKRIQGRMKEISEYAKGMHAPVRFAPCRIHKIVEGVEKALRVLLEQKQVVLRMEGLETLPEISADETRLFSAIYNLVHNAIPEVPPHGSITIHGCLDAPKASILLTIQDTGKGMPAEIRESLFTGRTVSTKIGGTGLGTKIVKDAVDAHGGQISVDSEEGKGTTFRIRLPLTPVTSP